MAKLSSHGQEIGRIETTSYRIAFFSDGHILRDFGYGWKLYKKFKDTVDPKEGFRKWKQSAEDTLRQRPRYAEWYKAITAYSLKLRTRLKLAIEMLPDDPDGVFSEMDDYEFSGRITVDDAIYLCRLYRSYKRECEELKKESVPA